MPCNLGFEEENEENEDKVSIAGTFVKCVACYVEEACPGCPIYGVIRSIKES